MIERTVTFRDRYGLHPRSAHRILQVLAGVEANVTFTSVEGGGSPIDARSMLALISSGIHAGEQVRVTADGPDESVVLDSMTALIEGGVCHP